MSISELIYNKIENEAVYYNNSDSSDCNVFLCSIAISLKRIADKLEIAQKQPIIMTAEEYSIYQHKLKEV